MVAMMAIAISAAAMPFSEASNKALFLSDKMAYELTLTEAQYEAVYEINLDYMLNLDEESDVQGYQWNIRNRDLGQVLSSPQYANYQARDWFYCPFAMSDGGWTLSVYDRYDNGKLLMGEPDVFLSYQGGHNQMDSSFYAGFNFAGDVSVYLGQAD